MPSRSFNDSDGRTWMVWEVVPGSATGRRASALPAQLRAGWLAFECGPIKRRLAPIPPGWQVMEDGALAGLCGCAPTISRADSDDDGPQPVA